MEITKTQIAVFAYRSMPNRPLEAWLDRIRVGGGHVRYAPDTSPVELAREQVCNRFLEEDAPAGRTHLLMIDGDMVPLAASDRTAGTAPILTADGEMIYCGFVGREGMAGHWGDDDFGMACCRLSADVLRGVAKPWFPLSIDGDRHVGCECLAFFARAVQAGVASRMAGSVGHLQHIVLFPDRQGRVASTWPWQAAESAEDVPIDAQTGGSEP
ncbi:MAG TPA: hypothetical protein VM238_10535 [Phycisphaerae bacterium]|nr:hypothetical protein [Phycisphaerae bacterium]